MNIRVDNIDLHVGSIDVRICRIDTCVDRDIVSCIRGGIARGVACGIHGGVGRGVASRFCARVENDTSCPALVRRTGCERKE